ncbi:hypothetical protein PUN28_002526 [Cardiocondyla obscurior]|uniref:Uncharacterized protein n=1 Tax=Cardiocondyla obscurior TaxID=286306 RepID=A0AAW2GUM0_9HYME
MIACNQTSPRLQLARSRKREKERAMKIRTRDLVAGTPQSVFLSTKLNFNSSVCVDLSGSNWRIYRETLSTCGTLILNLSFRLKRTPDVAVKLLWRRLIKLKLGQFRKTYSDITRLLYFNNFFFFF